MKVKFICAKCGYVFEKDEQEIIEQPFRYCACGGKLSIQNLEDIMQYDLDTRVRNNINRWFRELGIEGTIELIERNSNQACSRLYFDELRKRGVIR
jgi:predicted  nucleic acid-binding Zn-ribbon protein